ncbi:MULTISPECIES: DUF637 domain-containing protein [unclassified Pseudodesulfovibrio]|uniref:two-partner secretion domain-containing protein n=1 Tax=unclassified Pseudodesulfovibrio TaxID=2661612 RepID=UPI000FEB73D1|nr:MULTISPECIES: DUF637 domain-containing protein [unclassified Pseudodesulfovibrio]MCJ2164789.1 DUF637 domain-containing protein [Pseudodesulfovibrio sp. S3-i]RWU03839.1 filamentous hemagglutinin N-terminal domain-containing protein [Pseudodesulfovibrio sp. S3]
MLNALKQLLIAFMIGLILCPPSLVYAEGIHVDPNAAAQHQATMEAARNGVPVVNIAAPNGSGLSHNQFTDFNVGTQGVVINNSTGVGVSQLGGALASNPNFNGRAASTILNEVTGNGRSNIQGFTEIFGQAANYILANPNGISVNGGGFINTPKASLVTGTPEFSGNNLLGLNVSGGDILVHGAGINANNIDAFELVTRVANINAEIYAKKLNIVTGRNLYNPATETATPLAADGSPVPTVSIDSTALGGMYAGRIKLVGTEAGVGVNTQGIVQATQHLEMTADGKIQIKDSASSAGTLALTSNSDAVEISGTVKAAGTATIAGQTVTVTKVDPTDAAVISAAKVVVNAGTLDNRHLVAADTDLTVSATFLNNIGTLYSGGTGLFRISDTLHNNQGTILSKGDMVFEGAAAGQKMETLHNDSAVIESLDGGLTFRAKTFNNNNSLFTLVEGDQVLFYEEAGYWTGRDRNRGRTDTIFELYTGRAPLGSPPRTIALIYPGHLEAIGLDSSRHAHSRQEMLDALAIVDAAQAADPDALTADQILLVDQVRTMVNTGKLYFGTIEAFTSGYFVAASVTQDTATGQDQGAAIAAQGNILVEADTATNNVSTITSATGDIQINADTFANVGQGIYKRTTYEWGRGVYHSHSTPHIVPTGGGKETALTPIDSAYGLLEAGGKVSISSGVVANGVVEHNGVLNPPDPASQAQKVDDVAAITNALPSNGLFQPNTDPAQNYQIETNPNLTDLNNFFGSDYALTHMGFDPNDIANKRLCDGYCETTTVSKQIQELTGRRFLEDGVATDTEQFVKLMDNAVQAQTGLSLSVGVALSREQVAALTQDIVWLERQTVNGEEVLVPVVYLCSNSMKDIIQDGSSIIGREVEIDADTVVNAGLIKSDGQLTATAESFFNMGGTVAGQDISITATDSIYNTGGTVSGDTVALTAAKDVVSTSETVEFSGLGTAYDQVSKRANISSTGSLSIQAGGNVTVVGTDLKSGGDTTLSAGDSVVISSQELEYANKLSGSGFSTHTDITHNRSSTVDTGGNLKIEAGKDVAVHGSQLESSGDTNIKAGGNVSVTAATDSTDFYSHISGGGGGLFGGKKSQTAVLQQKQNVASSIKSGGSVTMESGTSDATGSLSVVGSKLEAEDDITLKSANELLIASGEEQHYQKNEEKKSGFMGTGSMELSEHNGVSTVRSEVEGGGKVALEAKNDITLKAATIKSGDETEITSTDGQVAMLVTKDSEYERVVKSSTGYFSWSTSDEGTNDETVQHTKITAGGGLTITTAEGVVVQYKETGNVQEDIAQLAQAPGLEWMGEIAQRDDVDWQAVQEVHNQWKESDSGIGGPGMQLVSLAMAVALSFTPGGQSFATGVLKMAGDSAMTAAVAAGFNSLVIQAGMQIVGNGGDIGAALQALASIDTIRALATAMLTAGLSKGLTDYINGGDQVAAATEAASDASETVNEASFIADLAQSLQDNAIQAGVSTGVDTAINGGNLGENLLANMRSAAVSSLGAELANEIGSAYADGDLNYVTHKIAHAALGGAMDVAMGGDGVSGAIGGVVGEITGEALAGEIEEALLSGDIASSRIKEWTDAGVDLSKLAAGLAAAAAGQDIDTAANAGENAAANNAAQFLFVLCTLNPVVLALMVGTAAGAIYIQTHQDEIRQGSASALAALKQFAANLSASLSDEEKQQIIGIPSSTPTNGVSTGTEGSPSDTVVDSGSTTTPDDSGLVDSGTVSGDTSGQVDYNGVVTQVEENWHQGTFPDTTSSIDYHLAKHGKGRSAEEYTNDAMEFFSKHKGEAQEVLLKDGTPGLKVQIKTIVNGKAVRQGGYWTKGGKLVTYWD